MESRVANTRRNIIASYVFMILQIIFSFVSKSVIAYTLGSEYLGLSSLFNSILMVLNVAEMGFTTSIVYFLYRPLAENDTERICALLAYLKNVYKVVGIIIVIFGSLAGIMLPWLINGNVPDNINIYILYFLYLINTAISYFLFAHKTALLTAAQRLDLVKIVGCAVQLIQYSLQLISLIVFRNYYLFVASLIIGTAITNIFTAYISNKKFPQYKCAGNIDEHDKKCIIAKVKGLLICNISIVTYSTLDSIVISAFIGLTTVAIYSNYMTIYKAVNQFMVMIRSAMQSSVGNSVARESISKNLQDAYLWQFLFSIISTWCATCMMCLYQPFIKLWMGEGMLLPILDVSLIVIWFSVDIVQQAHYLYLTGAGIWNDLKYSYIFNTCCNLVLNILLGKVIGVTGILIASLVTCIISGTFWQCIIIFRQYFKTSAKKYILNQLKYFGFSAIIVGTTYFITLVITFEFEGILGFGFKLLICSVISWTLLLLIYHRSPFFLDSLALVKKIIARK